MSKFSAIRIVLALGALSAAILASQAFAHGLSAPVITLLGPANGSTLISSAGSSDYPTFTWQIAWDVPETTTVLYQIAADPAFSCAPYAIA